MTLYGTLLVHADGQLVKAIKSVGDLAAYLSRSKLGSPGVHSLRTRGLHSPVVSLGCVQSSQVNGGTSHQPLPGPLPAHNGTYE